MSSPWIDDRTKSPGESGSLLDAPTQGLAEPLPNNVSAERAVLASCLLHPDDAFAVARGQLLPDDFYLSAHQKIWQTMRELADLGSPIDIITVKARMQDRGTLDAIGGPAYLDQIYDETGSSQNIQHYVRVVQDKAWRRAVLWHLQKLGDAARNGSSSEHLRGLLRNPPDSVELDETILPAVDFYADSPVIPWTVEDWLARGTLTLLGGASGDGKSMIVQHLAVELCRPSGSFLGQPIQGGPYRVLYLDAENPEAAVIKPRMRALLATGETTDDRLHYVSLPSANLEDPRVYRLVEQTIQVHRADWVIFDSLTRFHDGRNENDNPQMRQFLSDFMRRLTRDVCGGIVLHHLGKRGEGRTDLRSRLRGASGIYDECDHVWFIQTEKNAVKKMHYDKPRIPGAEQPVEVEFIDTAEDGLEIRARPPKVDGKKIILDTIDQRKGRVFRQDILAAANAAGLGERGTSKQLRRLVQKGVLQKGSEGREAWYCRAEPPQ